VLDEICLRPIVGPGQSASVPSVKRRSSVSRNLSLSSVWNGAGPLVRPPTRRCRCSAWRTANSASMVAGRYWRPRGLTTRHPRLRAIAARPMSLVTTTSPAASRGTMAKSAESRPDPTCRISTPGCPTNRERFWDWLATSTIGIERDRDNATASRVTGQASASMKILVMPKDYTCSLSWPPAVGPSRGDLAASPAQEARRGLRWTGSHIPGEDLSLESGCRPSGRRSLGSAPEIIWWCQRVVRPPMAWPSESSETCRGIQGRRQPILVRLRISWSIPRSNRQPGTHHGETPFHQLHRLVSRGPGPSQVGLLSSISTGRGHLVKHPKICTVISP
jgi:hypothetical protein